MARGYRTSTPTLVDFVSRLPEDFLKMEAQADAQLASSIGAISSLDQLYDGQTWNTENARQAYQSEVNTLRKKQLEVQESLMSGGVNPDNLRSLQELGNQVSDSKRRGTLYQLETSYANAVGEYQRKLKDKDFDNDRANLEWQLRNQQAASMGDRIGQGPLPSLEVFNTFDQNELLKENIKGSENKLTTEQFGQLQKVGNIRFKYSQDKVTAEGYNVNGMKAASVNTLLATKDYIQDKQTEYQYEGVLDSQGRPRDPGFAQYLSTKPAMDKDGSPVEVPREDPLEPSFENYLNYKADRDSDVYVSRFTGESLSVDRDRITDDNALDAAKQARRDSYKKQEENRTRRSNATFTTGSMTVSPIGLESATTSIKASRERLKNIERDIASTPASESTKLNILREARIATQTKLDLDSKNREIAFNAKMNNLPNHLREDLNVIAEELKKQGKELTYDNLKQIDFESNVDVESLPGAPNGIYIPGTDTFREWLLTNNREFKEVVDYLDEPGQDIDVATNVIRTGSRPVDSEVNQMLATRISNNGGSNALSLGGEDTGISEAQVSSMLQTKDAVIQGYDLNQDKILVLVHGNEDMGIPAQVVQVGSTPGAQVDIVKEISARSDKGEFADPSTISTINNIAAASSDQGYRNNIAQRIDQTERSLGDELVTEEMPNGVTAKYYSGDYTGSFDPSNLNIARAQYEVDQIGTLNAPINGKGEDETNRIGRLYRNYAATLAANKVSILETQPGASKVISHGGVDIYIGRDSKGKIHTYPLPNDPNRPKGGRELSSYISRLNKEGVITKIDLN